MIESGFQSLRNYFQAYLRQKSAKIAPISALWTFGRVILGLFGLSLLILFHFDNENSMFSRVFCVILVCGICGFQVNSAYRGMFVWDEFLAFVRLVVFFLAVCFVIVHSWQWRLIMLLMPAMLIETLALYADYLDLEKPSAQSVADGVASSGSSSSSSGWKSITLQELLLRSDSFRLIFTVESVCYVMVFIDMMGTSFILGLPLVTIPQALSLLVTYRYSDKKSVSWPSTLLLLSFVATQLGAQYLKENKDYDYNFGTVYHALGNYFVSSDVVTEKDGL